MNIAKLPPHDTDAEEAVIGSLLIDGAAIYQVAGLIQPSDFASERTAQVYGACFALYQRSEAINQITVAQELDRQGRLKACGGAAYLSQLISIVPTSLDIEHYAQIVYRLSVMRQLVSAGEKVAGIGYEADPDVGASLARAEDILFKLRPKGLSNDLRHIRQVLDRYFEETSTAAVDSRIQHVNSGFMTLDEFLGGFQRADLIIAAGRPSMGKTSLALGIARNAAVNYHACVALFSLEMSCDSLVDRLVSSESGVDLRRVRLRWQHEEKDDTEEKRLMAATGVLAEAPIYIDDTPMLRVAEMRGKLRHLHHERGVDLAIVDYLQLMQADGRTENRVQEISYITRALKGIAREFNVPLIAVSQLSRAVESRTTHKPQLSDLRESGSIEQDADIVLFVYRDEVYYTQDEWKNNHPEEGLPYPPPAQIIIAKHRNGPTGEVSLRFIPKLAKFENIANAEVNLL